MKLNHISAWTFGIIALIATASCGSKPGGDYSVTVEFTPSDNDHIAYLVDYDTSDKIDSVKVTDARAVFTGHVDKPLLARVILGSDRVGSFILEPGTIEFNNEMRRGEGSPLNNRFNAINDSLEAIQIEFEKLDRDSTFESRANELEKRFKTVSRNALESNSDNPIGYYFLIQDAYEMNQSELEEALAKYPAFAKSKRLNDLKDALKRKHETSAGKPFKDFEVVYNDSVQRLSDHVGKGRLTLVDFWASWCGPCIRETKVIKELYQKYSDRMDFLGVAVWDEPDNTLEAIQRHKLPWPQILNAKQIPTDIYGISGIPCIILIGPDGTILSRDKQDDALVADVEAALERENQQ